MRGEEEPKRGAGRSGAREGEGDGQEGPGEEGE